jgi:hypothetical protein
MSRYITNPQAIHETIDGETIIINLATGTYYSLLGAAPTIWNAVSEGTTAAGVAQRVERAYDAPSDEVTNAVEAFLRELEAEDLVALGDGSEADAAPPAGNGAVAGQRMPFVAPKLEKYTDMQDIILLDPVHKVDSQGWPHAAEPTAG